MCACMTDLLDNIHSRFIIFFSKDWNVVDNEKYYFMHPPNACTYPADSHHRLLGTQYLQNHWSKSVLILYVDYYLPDHEKKSFCSRFIYFHKNTTS